MKTNASMRKLLICDGIMVGGVGIPPFEVSIADYVGVAETTNTCEHRYELIRILGGLSPTSSVHILGKASVISPPGFDTLEQDGLLTITDVATARGLSLVAVEDIINELGLEADLPYYQLRLNHRLRFELRLAWKLGAELVIFSAGGLDPSGIARVSDDVLDMLDQCSAVHTFPLELIEDYESLCMFSKIVYCDLQEGE